MNNNFPYYSHSPCNCPCWSKSEKVFKLNSQHFIFILLNLLTWLCMIYSLIRSLFISHWFLFQAFSSSFFWKNGVTMKKTVLTTEILDYKISRLVLVLNLIHRKYQIENCSHHWLFLVLQNKLNGKISHFSHWECSDKRDCMSQNVKRDERWNCLITVR